MVLYILVAHFHTTVDDKFVIGSDNNVKDNIQAASIQAAVRCKRYVELLHVCCTGPSTLAETNAQRDNCLPQTNHEL